MRSINLFLGFLLLTYAGFAQLRLPSVISSGMVLQQQDSVWVWGWAGPSEEVKITVGWDHQVYITKANNHASWRIKVKTPVAGGPYSMKFESRNTILLQNIMIGEVWVCSGQSNMEWSYNNGVKDIAEEFPNVATQNIRLFHVDKIGAAYPQEDVKAIWESVDSNNIKRFSAIGYFFGKKIHNTLKVPVGIINASWGGTPADTWTPQEEVLADSIFMADNRILWESPWWPKSPGHAYNGMIAPLTQFNIAGVIWYQGESNTDTHHSYERLMTKMIHSWRRNWQHDFPFYYVQIAPFNYNVADYGAFLQEAQTALMKIPHTGMVVTTDLIDSVTNIHPSRKKPVADRLAAWALADHYKQPIGPYKSPKLQSWTTEKSILRLHFMDAEDGWMIKGKQPEGFYIAGEDLKWKPAKVKIEGTSILLWHEQIKQPVYARYGFGNTLLGNLFSNNGLPLIPFRTDIH